MAASRSSAAWPAPESASLRSNQSVTTSWRGATLWNAFTIFRQSER